MKLLWKSRGVISVFLIIILIPTMLFSVILVDGSRMVSAEAISQEATDLALLSVMAAYDEKLKEDFGLFALENDADVKAIFEEYLQETLSATKVGDEMSYSDRLYNLTKSHLTGEDRFKDKQFLNLYDFSIENTEVTPIYSLANYQVLQNQMIEHSKYRGLYILAERFEILKQVDDIDRKLKANEKAANIIEEKMKIDEQNAKVDKKIKEVGELTASLNYNLSEINTIKDDYFDSLGARMEVLYLEEQGEAPDDSTKVRSKKFSSNEKKVRKYYEELEDTAIKIKNKSIELKGDTEENIARLKEFREKYKNDDSDVVKGLLGDATKEIEMYEIFYLKSIKELSSDKTLNLLVTSNLEMKFDTLLKDIKECIEKYGDESKGEAGSESVAYCYYYLNSDKSTENHESALDSYLEEYDSKNRSLYGSGVISINPARDYATGKTSDMTEEDAERIGEEANDSSKSSGDTDSRVRQSIEKSIYNSLPSRTFDPAKEAESYGGLIQEDTERIEEENSYQSNYDFDRENGLNSAKNLLGSGTSFLSDIGEASRDKVLTLSYIFGTFKTRMTGDQKFTADAYSNLPETEKNAKYLTKWRYLHEEGEWDLSFQAKKDRQTKLTAEVEYILFGLDSDLKNESAVYATIMGTRYANNLIALYANEGVKETCRAAALAATVACGGTVPVSVFFWIFMGAWAAAETLLDMKYLIEDGYRIPLFKTENNILLSLNLDGKPAIKSYEKDHFIDVCYEDYLALLLLCKSSEKAVMRVADLIEMNMKLQESSFKINQSFTYLRADSNLSIRFLFNSIPQFAESYEGLKERMYFKNTIYQGY